MGTDAQAPGSSGSHPPPRASWSCSSGSLGPLTPQGQNAQTLFCFHTRGKLKFTESKPLAESRMENKFSCIVLQSSDHLAVLPSS